MSSLESLQLLDEAKELLAQARATNTLADSNYKKQIDKLSAEVAKLKAKVDVEPSVEKEAGAVDEFGLGEVTGSADSGSGRHPLKDLLDKIVD